MIINHTQQNIFVMKDRIKKVMARALEVPVTEITEHSSQDTIENWDSMRHMSLIVFLEREFDITIPDEEVGKMITFKFIEEIIKKCHEQRT
jgi:acyl carrier protein